MRQERLKLAKPDQINILAFGDSLTEGYTDFGMTFHSYAIELKKKLSSLFPKFTVNVDVNGRSGDRVLSSLNGAFLQRLQSSCPPSSADPPKYDLIITLGGTNDLGYMINDPECAKEIFKGLQECYDHALSSGASLLCLTVPERALDTGTSAYAKKAKNSRLQLNELITKFANSRREKVQEEDKSGDVTASTAGTSKYADSIYIMDLAAMVPFPPNIEDEEQDYSIWSPDGLHMTSQGYDFVGQELASFIYDIVYFPRD